MAQPGAIELPSGLNFDPASSASSVSTNCLSLVDAASVRTMGNLLIDSYIWDLICKKYTQILPNEMEHIEKFQKEFNAKKDQGFTYDDNFLIETRIAKILQEKSSFEAMNRSIYCHAQYILFCADNKRDCGLTCFLCNKPKAYISTFHFRNHLLKHTIMLNDMNLDPSSINSLVEHLSKAPSNIADFSYIVKKLDMLKEHVTDNITEVLEEQVVSQPLQTVEETSRAVESIQYNYSYFDNVSIYEKLTLIVVIC